MDPRESQVRATLNQKMLETGEKDRLKELLRMRLNETGWHDDIRMHARDIVKAKGVENVTVDDLVTEITPKGRAAVPASVKKELVQKIRNFLDVHNIV